MPSYQWIQLTAAINALAGRLADPTMTYWTYAELVLYLQEALRTWNALTEQWNTDFAFSSSPLNVWYNLSTAPGSPRLRTLTDASLYSLMQYHLLEPPTGAGPWKGTSQFTLAALQYALQHRRDEVIQASGCNLQILGTGNGGVQGVTIQNGGNNYFVGDVLNLVLPGGSGCQITVLSVNVPLFQPQIGPIATVSVSAPGQGYTLASNVPATGGNGYGAAFNISQLIGGNIPSTPNVARTYLPDTTLEPRRVRFVPATGSPVTLTREDTLTFDAFEPSHKQTPMMPSSWSVVTEPPLAIEVDTAPNVAGAYDVIGLVSGPTFTPPAATLLGVPDDWAWVAKWGAMGDILSADSEATDRIRADYCLKRYLSGLKIMAASNWLVSATINGVPCDTPSLFEMDAFSPEWQNNSTLWPMVVQAGMDFIAPCPVAAAGVSVNVVGNAPVPVNPTDYVQCSRDVFEAILAYAQVLASFKQGGEEFTSTKDLEKNFFEFAMQTNKRLAQLGLLTDVARSEGQKEEVQEPRQ